MNVCSNAGAKIQLLFTFPNDFYSFFLLCFNFVFKTLITRSLVNAFFAIVCFFKFKNSFERSVGLQNRGANG